MFSGTDLKQPEPAKRVRRWSSSNNVQVGITKPLTMDSVKEITSPEIVEGSPVGISKSFPKVLATPGIKQNSSVDVSKPSPKIVAGIKMNTTIPKSEPEANGTKRVGHNHNFLVILYSLFFLVIFTSLLGFIFQFLLRLDLLQRPSRLKGLFGHLP